MRITKPFALHLIGGIALIAVAAPGFAQTNVPANRSTRFAVQVVPTTAAKRATNLQKAPIAINFFEVASQDRAAPNARTEVAVASLSQGQN